MTQRSLAHFEKKEPFLEKLLFDLRFRKISKHIPDNSKMLDLGCGYDGKLLFRLRDKIKIGFGIDISIDENKRDEKITLLKHDLAEALPFENNSFDVVTSLANLEHLHNPEFSLKEIHRILKPDGILLLTTPSINGKPVLEFLAFIGLVSKQEIQDHKNYFGKYSLLTLCQQTGFSLSQHKYFQLGMNNFLIARK